MALAAAARSGGDRDAPGRCRRPRRGARRAGAPGDHAAPHRRPRAADEPRDPRPGARPRSGRPARLPGAARGPPAARGVDRGPGDRGGGPRPGRARRPVRLPGRGARGRAAADLARRRSGPRELARRARGHRARRARGPGVDRRARGARARAHRHLEPARALQPRIRLRDRGDAFPDGARAGRVRAPPDADRRRAVRDARAQGVRGQGAGRRRAAPPPRIRAVRGGAPPRGRAGGGPLDDGAGAGAARRLRVAGRGGARPRGAHRHPHRTEHVGQVRLPPPDGPHRDHGADRRLRPGARGARGRDRPRVHAGRRAGQPRPRPEHIPRGGRPRDVDVRRPRDRLGGRRSPARPRARRQGPVRDALPRAHAARGPARRRAQLPRGRARVERRDRLPAQGAAGRHRPELRRPGRAAGGAAGGGDRALEGAPGRAGRGRPDAHRRQRRRAARALRARRTRSAPGRAGEPRPGPSHTARGAEHPGEVAAAARRSLIRIRRLPDHLVNKIAAGEVVERPASAVKELVENALDAGALTITVDLRDGGSALIRVTDDGIGMTADELPLALERHATSKLARDEDLDAIATLGFRGEALAAICAVSRFTLTSCARGVLQGLRLAGEGGTVKQRLEVPADAGTSVEVRDLFFNTPARLKFLKSSATELSASLRALTQLALAHPRTHVRVANNGRAVLTVPAASELRARVGAVWGHDVAERLLAVDRTEHGVRVQGLISPPDLARGNRDEIVLIVNGRPVRDPALLQATLDAYRPLLPRDRFPVALLAITLAETDVDVNVHPTKAWVRFRHPRLIYEMVAAATLGGLRRPAVMPDVGPRAEGGRLDEEAPGGVAEQTALFGVAALVEPRALFGRVLGQVQDTFVVSTSDEEVFFLDQHVAHERVLFERLQRDLRAGTPAAQSLLFAEPLELAPASCALLERWRAPLERLGFAFEGLGTAAVVVRAVPALLKGSEPRRLIEAAVDEFGGPGVGEPTLDRALAFVACRAAVKANMPLAREEMDRLVAELSVTETPYFCPHGRPIVSRVSLHDIRRELKRTW